jgi:hypothetical protein
MIHIQPYEILNESYSSKGKQGYVVLIKAHNRDTYWFYYCVGVADDFYEFAQGIMESHYAYPDDNDILDLKNRADISDTMETVSDAMEVREYEYCFWHGLIPRNSKQDIYEELSLDNIYQATDRLDELFTNAKDVMLKYPSGNEDDLTYIARSVESRPEALGLYADEPRFEKILNLANMNPKKKKAMMTLIKTKGMI